MGGTNRWTVLSRRRDGSDWEPVGEVHAPDEDMAVLLAKESFFRHGEGVDLAVARDGSFRALGDPDLLAFATDKSYKLQHGYTGLGGKRRRAMARVADLGARIDRPRPEDRRVLRAGEGGPPGPAAGAADAGPAGGAAESGPAAGAAESGPAAGAAESGHDPVDGSGHDPVDGSGHDAVDASGPPAGGDLESGAGPDHG